MTEGATQPTRVVLALHCETQVHVGVGQVAGAVDLPVAREAVTGYPVLPGSSLKGAMRDRMRWRKDSAYDASTNQDHEKVISLFGGPRFEDAVDTSTPSAKVDRAGSLLIGDGRLLLLPVRSLSETFRWVICPALIARFIRDMDRVGRPVRFNTDDLQPNSTPPTALVGDKLDRLYLEELVFGTEVKPQAISELAKTISQFVPKTARATLASRLAVIHDDAFGFLARHALPVRQRNALEAGTKIVADGALWSEEMVAADTLFYMIIAERYGGPSASLDDYLESFTGDPYLQVGGKETIGCGWLHVTQPSAAEPVE